MRLKTLSCTSLSFTSLAKVEALILLKSSSRRFAMAAEDTLLLASILAAAPVLMLLFTCSYFGFLGGFLSRGPPMGLIAFFLDSALLAQKKGPGHCPLQRTG